MVLKTMLLSMMAQQPTADSDECEDHAMEKEKTEAVEAPSIQSQTHCCFQRRPKRTISAGSLWQEEDWSDKSREEGKSGAWVLD